MSSIPSDLLQTVRTASSIVVLTGAGVSAESGIPTFRDAMDGLWARFNPEDLATPEAFARDPQLVSQWYDERRCKLAMCKPNPAHLALAQLQRWMREHDRSMTLVTQNIDRLHQEAGSDDVIELHGSLRVWRCTRCEKETDERGPAFETHPPRCSCGGARRPSVVWFGEALPADAITRAQRASVGCRLFMSIGTSGVVYPAAGLIDLARTTGARVLEVNPAVTTASAKADWAIHEPAGAFLPALVQQLMEQAV